MKISLFANNYIYRQKPITQSNSKVSFGQTNTDIFVRSSNGINTGKLLEVLNGDFRKLNKDFFRNLTEEEYHFCLNWAKSDEKKFSGMILYSPKAVLPEDVRDIVKYTDYYYSGLQKIAYRSNKSMEDIMLVGIGQSPVAAVKLMELAGVKTAYCPISGLTTFNEPIDKYLTPKNLDKYLDYLKKFGFSIDDLFGDKLIIFTDHKETGRTFEVFKEIINRIIKLKKDEMKKQGKKPAKIKFLPLSDIYKAAKKDSKERQWGNEFEESVYHTSYLKTLYSPLFKLPLSRISEIRELHEAAKKSDRSIRFNKLTVLMYDELYHQRTEIPKRLYSTVEHDRQFRLSFYTPD